MSKIVFFLIKTIFIYFNNKNSKIKNSKNVSACRINKKKVRSKKSNIEEEKK